MKRERRKKLKERDGNRVRVEERKWKKSNNFIATTLLSMHINKVIRRDLRKNVGETLQADKKLKMVKKRGGEGER